MPRTKTISQPKAPIASKSLKAVPHPVACREGRGVRFFDCTHYDDCLDQAAKALWTGFTCSRCPFYQNPFHSA
ncbi:hypothetical protein [Desulfosoma caldarium]|uniref:Uncharacterized protein n=1 Tax=Desulfosoma caldarium TaxID=610254 RepID=A0A3N1VFU5_9BACT|nr:hypothetical protein [Desulfosoma caldarium]ROR01704.1 hypothetical protein EDC27_0887 [Desulfosoma caldarium]